MSRISYLAACAAIGVLFSSVTATAQVAQANKDEFFQAIAAGRADAVDDLLQKSPALIYAVRPWGITGLHVAGKHGQVEIAKLLLDHGADVNSIRRGAEESPLATALLSGHLEVARQFISHGADVNFKHAKGTLLQKAVRRRLGVSDSGYEWKRKAFEKETLDEMRLLLKHGADPNAHVEHTEPPLISAIQFRQFPRVKLLLDHGADVDVRDYRGRSALFMALNPFGIYKDMVELLQTAGAQPCAFAAAQLGDVEALRTFIANDPAVISRDGTDLLDSAARFKQRTTARLLIESGAKPTSHSFSFVVGTRQSDLVQLLLDRADDINSLFPDQNGYASRFDSEKTQLGLINTDTVHRLLIAGGALDNARKRMPFFYASRKEIYRTLRKRIAAKRLSADRHPPPNAFKEGAFYIIPGGIVQEEQGDLYFAISNRDGRRHVEFEFDTDHGFVHVLQSSDGKTTFEVFEMQEKQSRRAYAAPLQLKQQQHGIYAKYESIRKRVRGIPLDENNVFSPTRSLKMSGTMSGNFDKAGKEPRDLEALFELITRGDINGVKAELQERPDSAGALTNYAGVAPLHVAVRFDRKDILRMLLAADADVNKTTVTGRWTPLHIAAALGRGEIARMLINAGAKNALNEAMENPLMLAAETGHHKIVGMLLEDVLPTDAFAFRALQRAFNNGHNRVVEMFLAHGVRHVNRDELWIPTEERGNAERIKRRVERSTAWVHFPLACMTGDTQRAEELLKLDPKLAGELIDFVSDRRRATPLEIAATIENTKLVKLLLDNGAKPSAFRDIPGGHGEMHALHRAIKAGNREIVLMLLDTEVDLDAGYWWSGVGRLSGPEMTALGLCVVYRQKTIANDLIKKGAKAEGLEIAAGRDDIDFMNFLLKHGADSEDDLNAAMVSAAIGGSVNAIDLLLKRGANANHVNRRGTSILQAATLNRRMEVVKRLLAAGVPPDIHSAILLDDAEMLRRLLKKEPGRANTPNFGATPLSYGIRLRRLAMVKTLLELGADPNDGKARRNTSLGLQWACASGDLEIVQALVKHGANVNARFGDGDTALHVVVNNWKTTPNSAEIVAILIRAGADPDAKDRAGRPPCDQNVSDEIKRAFNKQKKPSTAEAPP